jgi:UDP:flavonoid glycosyltransferase YjiC (YdhE family)
MKILVASTPATGHLNPLLAIGHILIGEGHDVGFLSGSVLRDRIEGIGAKFHAFPAGADFDLRSVDSVFPELTTMAPGPDWLRTVMERVFVDAVPAQHQGLQQVLQGSPADVNARVAGSGVGINLATNEPTPQALRAAVRAVLDTPNCRSRASLMAAEFEAIDTRSEIVRIVDRIACSANRETQRAVMAAKQRGGRRTSRTAPVSGA